MALTNHAVQFSTVFSDPVYREVSDAHSESGTDPSFFGLQDRVGDKSTISALVASELPVSSGEQEMVRLVKPSPVRRKSFEWEAIVQSWEGRVIFNNFESKEFVAIIRDLTCRENPEEEVVIGYESVLASDVGLVEEGAIFFWNIGRYRKFSESSGRAGPSRHKFEIRFRRLPPLSVDRLNDIIESSKRMSERLHAN